MSAFPAALYADRRRRLAQAIGEGVAVIPTAPERVRNRDAHYPYRFDSYFYYLTGFTEPEAVLFVTGGAAAKSVLFCRPRDAEREIWDGHRYGPDGAREVFGIDEAHTIDTLDAQAPTLLADRPALHVHLGEDPGWDRRLVGWLNALRAQCRTGVTAPPEIRDVRALLDDMRLVKDAHELKTMRRAAAITADAHRRAMRATRPGVHEYEVEAELLYEFRRRGAQAPAYTPIVAGGANACVLHYVENDAPLKDGELLLIDAGCEVDGYAADVTRSFPVNGRYSGPQRELYELVLAAQAAAIAEVKPGAAWEAPHDAAVKTLAQGFIDTGLCQGSVDAVIESGDYKRFYMHRTSHWLGMDVHDVGRYHQNGAPRPLEPGFVLTIEPGLYIANNAANADVDPRFFNIGVRIEDDILVSASGQDNLTHDIPKHVSELEAILRDR